MEPTIEIRLPTPWTGGRPLGNWVSGWSFKHDGKGYGTVGITDEKPTEETLKQEALETFNRIKT